MAALLILPDVFLKRRRAAIPSRTVTVPRMMVKNPHERMPVIMLTIPSQFLFPFGAGAGGAAGTGCGAGAAAGAGAGGTVCCAAGCCRPMGFPQFLQNRLVSGFSAPHSLQNTGDTPDIRIYRRAAHRVLSPTPWPLARRARHVVWLISPTNIRLIFSLPMAVQAAGLLSWIATSQRQSTLR